MMSAVALGADHGSIVDAYVAAMQSVGRKTGRSTVQAARTFSAKLDRAGGWRHLSRARQLDAVRKARGFASWLMVTGQLIVEADVLGRVDLRLGNAARQFCPDAQASFVEACERLSVAPSDVTLQWNALAKVTAITGILPDRVGDQEFEFARTAIIDAYTARDLPESGRNMASIFHRLQLTLFHAGQLDTHKRPARREPVSVTGWSGSLRAWRMRPAATSPRSISAFGPPRSSTSSTTYGSSAPGSPGLTQRWPAALTSNAATLRPTRPGWPPSRAATPASHSTGSASRTA